MARVDTELTQATLDCARTAFGGVSIVATATLRDRPGWPVERLALVTGTGASVADRLMGDDPGEATAAVQRWAQAVARSGRFDARRHGPGQQRRDAGRAGADRLRKRRVPARRMGRGLPDRAVADLLVQLADARCRAAWGDCPLLLSPAWR